MTAKRTVQHWRLCRALALTSLGLGLGFAQQTLADPTWHSSTIKWLYPQADGSMVITFYADHAACLNTAVPKYFLIKTGLSGVTIDGQKTMIAIATAAFAMGKSVQINFESATADCAINRLLVID